MTLGVVATIEFLVIVWLLLVHSEPNPNKGLEIMPTIELDATQRVRIVNPVAVVKDSEGSPIGDPTPVENFAVAIENAEGDFGTVGQDENGWFFDPGTEISGQASGDLVFTGTAQGIEATGRLTLQLRPGAPARAEISAELTPVS